MHIRQFIAWRPNAAAAAAAGDDDDALKILMKQLYIQVKLQD